MKQASLARAHAGVYIVLRVPSDFLKYNFVRMKRSIFFILAIIAFVQYLPAYDYQTVYSHRTATFSYANGNILGMRIDSVKFEQDSILYPLKNVQLTSYDCYLPQGASWLGSKIIVGKSWNYFLNYKGDTIKIKTDAKSGESWDAFMAAGIKVTASVQKVEEISFLGLIDSVKTIVFNGTPLTSSGVSTQNKSAHVTSSGVVTIQISKRFGLLATFDFLHFPYYNENVCSNFYMPETFIGAWIPIKLVGLTNPSVGMQNLTWFEVFDFQVGDEMHTIYKTRPVVLPPPAIYTTTIKRIKKVLSRVDYKDSIIYSMADLTETTNLTSGKNSVLSSTDTIRLVIRANADFDKLSTETVIIDQRVAFSYYMHQDSILSKIRPSVYNEAWKWQDESCWRHPLADGCFPDNSYYKGLGGPYYSCDDGFNGSIEENLVYYKKGTITGGTPLQITGFTKTEANPSIEVFPNPTAGYLFVGKNQLNGVYCFELLDISGSVVLRCNVDANSNAVNLGGVAKGLYLYRLTNNAKLLKTGKIVKN